MSVVESLQVIPIGRDAFHRVSEIRPGCDIEWDAVERFPTNFE
jgi:hypothetical protein